MTDIHKCPMEELQSRRENGDRQKDRFVCMNNLSVLEYAKIRTYMHDTGSEIGTPRGR